MNIIENYKNKTHNNNRLKKYNNKNRMIKKTKKASISSFIGLRNSQHTLFCLNNHLL